MFARIPTNNMSGHSLILGHLSYLISLSLSLSLFYLFFLLPFPSFLTSFHRHYSVCYNWYKVADSSQFLLYLLYIRLSLFLFLLLPTYLSLISNIFTSLQLFLILYYILSFLWTVRMCRLSDTQPLTSRWSSSSLVLLSSFPSFLLFVILRLFISTYFHTSSTHVTFYHGIQRAVRCESTSITWWSWQRLQGETRIPSSIPAIW